MCRIAARRRSRRICLAEQVHVGTDFMPTYVPLVNDGRLRRTGGDVERAGAGTAERHDGAGSGFPGFEATAWYAIVAPAGTADDIVRKINAATNDYLEEPEGKAQLIQFPCWPRAARRTT